MIYCSFWRMSYNILYSTLILYSIIWFSYAQIHSRNGDLAQWGGYSTLPSYMFVCRTILSIQHTRIQGQHTYKQHRLCPLYALSLPKIPSLCGVMPCPRFSTKSKFTFLLRHVDPITYAKPYANSCNFQKVWRRYVCCGLWRKCMYTLLLMLQCKYCSTISFESIYACALCHYAVPRL